jgi:hypothetical protein
MKDKDKKGTKSPGCPSVTALHVIIHGLGIASEISILLPSNPASSVYFPIPGAYKETP